MKALIHSAAMLGLLGSSTVYAADPHSAVAAAGTGPAVAAGMLFAALLIRKKD